MGDIVTGAGLVVGVVGAWMVWSWPLPAPEGDALLLESAPDHGERNRQRDQQTRRAQWGMRLIGVAFLLQLLGLLIA